MTVPLFLFVVCVAAGGAIYLWRKRRRQRTRRHLTAFADTLAAFPLYSCREEKEEEKRYPLHSSNILADLDACFEGRYITFRVAADITAYYATLYDEAGVLRTASERYNFALPPTITQFLSAYTTIEGHIRQHNARHIARLLEDNKHFFDTCLRYPLDAQQRRAIVSEEEACLVVSSAGSGKTSTIEGRLRYLLDRKKVDPARILLVSFTHKAAAELTARVNVKGVAGYTFHKLALDIIGRQTGHKPTICETTETLLSDIFHALLREKPFYYDVVEYFADHYAAPSSPSAIPADWERPDERLKALFPDMDGHPIYVRSKQEQMICFALSSLGVAFRYEEPYEHRVDDATHAQYRPDFSIYYEAQGVRKRIYLEHFGVDKHSRVPQWFATENGISYDEANRRYNDGITWKKTVHERYGTVLLTTSSADFHYAEICDKIRALLASAQVPIRPLSDEALAQTILPKDSKEERLFLRLVSTFVELMKCSCRSSDEVVAAARAAHDGRSVFEVQRLFLPIYERYNDALHWRGEIDFTDAILQATALCEQTARQYDHILVDEFQDLSIDRYRFLLALRHGTPPATLYCVGDDWQSIYRFTGSDIALFNRFDDHFGRSEINKIETTYRFGEPLIAQSSAFILRNPSQIKKRIAPPRGSSTQTTLLFLPYTRKTYCDTVERIVATIPAGKTILFLGRYTFDDTLLRTRYTPQQQYERTFYHIAQHTIEFLTVHKAKGLEADYVVLLECNKDRYGFPSLVADDPALQYVLSAQDTYPHSEERRLFYVAITRARTATWVLYDQCAPSVFVEECMPDTPPTAQQAPPQTPPQHTNTNAPRNKNYYSPETATYIARK